MASQKLVCIVAALAFLAASLARADEFGLTQEQVAAASAAGVQMQVSYAAGSASVGGSAINADSTNLTARGTIAANTLWTAAGWDTSLVVPGPKGDTGAPGPQGVPGAPGATGATGAAGATLASCTGPHGCLLNFGSTTRTSAADCPNTTAIWQDGTIETITTTAYECGGGGAN